MYLCTSKSPINQAGLPGVLCPEIFGRGPQFGCTGPSGDGTPVPCDTSCDGNLPFREFYNQESGCV